MRKYGGLKVSKAKRLKCLEEENRRLKRVGRLRDEWLNQHWSSRSLMLVEQSRLGGWATTQLARTAASPP